MNKLYKKHKLNFSLRWIAIYVIALSLADNISDSFGAHKVITAPLCVIISAFLLLWLKKQNLLKVYGLCKPSGNHRKYLYYVPLILIASVGLWNGITLNYSILETLFHVISMLCVGFLEEIIFRGFLFKAMCEDRKSSSKRIAIIVSSVTFGIGHIVNLLNGADFLSTSLQICYATAIGFIFTILFDKSGSLIPCIITHSLLNALGAFSVKSSVTHAITISILLIVISISYAMIILRRTEPDSKMQNR